MTLFFIFFIFSPSQPIVSNQVESVVTNTNQESTKGETTPKDEHGAESSGSQTIEQSLDEEPPKTSSEENQPSSESKDEEAGPTPSFNVQSSLEKEDLVDHMKGVIYGNCIGDAIGLLTEFMTKSEAAEVSCYELQ